MGQVAHGAGGAWRAKIESRNWKFEIGKEKRGAAGKAGAGHPHSKNGSVAGGLTRVYIGSDLQGP
jgi:hypothetical protein